jgi:hypothetical protein
MVYTRRQKQALVAVCNPLRDAGIKQHIFSFLPGQWLFLGAVCKEWEALYASIADQRLCSLKVHIRKQLVSAAPKPSCVALQLPRLRQLSGRVLVGL